MEFKDCSACKRYLPVGDFYRMAAAPDGRQYRCKACTQRGWDDWTTRTGYVQPKPSRPTKVYAPRACGVCGVEFVPKRSDQINCRPNCRKPASRRRVVCAWCAVEFVAVGRRTYCSEDCSRALKREQMREFQRSRAVPRYCVGCGQRYHRCGRGGRCGQCLADRRADRERRRELREARRVVAVTVWNFCGCGGLKRLERRRCDGPGPHTAPRACTSCGGKWRPTDRPESQTATQCWECRRPKGNAARFSGVRERLRRLLIVRECGRCQDCGKTEADVGEPLHAHHVEPQALGGANTLENLRLLCPDCHNGSGWWRNHYMLALAGLVVAPVHAMAP